MGIQELPQGVLPGTISLVFGHPDPTVLPVDSLSDHRWFIQRRGKIEAVLTSLEEYKRLLELEELVDHMMLGRLIEERERTDSGHRISLDELVEK